MDSQARKAAETLHETARAAAESLVLQASDDVPYVTSPQGSQLLDAILAELAHELPDAVGAALSLDCRHASQGSSGLLAHWGCGAFLAQLQFDRESDSEFRALSLPVIVENIWTDSRWPQLTVNTLQAQWPQLADQLLSVRGAAAVFVDREARRDSIVLSVALTSTPDCQTLETLRRHERLAASALRVLGESLDNFRFAEGALDTLQARGAIEQAKGIVMGMGPCGADHAWEVLCTASAQLDVTVRNLAVALIEHLGDMPAEQPGDQRRHINPSAQDRRAAVTFWEALSSLNLPMSHAESAVSRSTWPAAHSRNRNGVRHTANGHMLRVLPD